MLPWTLDGMVLVLSLSARVSENVGLSPIGAEQRLNTTKVKKKTVWEVKT
jgi:hypothetical protein